jgi:hypothetical protein
MWKRFFRQERKQVNFMLTSPKSGVMTVPVTNLTSQKLRSLLENHAQALHFQGPEERLLNLLRDLGPQESLSLDNWKIIDADNNTRLVQVKLSGDREIRRVVKIMP